MAKKIELIDIYKLINNTKEEILEHIQNGYVTKQEFTPVRNIAFGIVGACCFTVLAALLAKVVHAIGTV